MARRWVWSFWEAAVGSLSEARTAVSSAKVAMVESKWRCNVFPAKYGLSFLHTECICVFRMVLTINSDCFLNSVNV
jgi:hypothetical protein